MKKNKVLAIVLIAVIVLGLVTYLFYSKNNKEVPVNEPVASSTAVVYSNADFGFTFSLPDSWKGYSIIKNTWQGNPLATNGSKESGPKLLIRNPKWTTSVPYQDIPVLVFTVAQWNSYVKEDFAVSAAPFQASELGRNNMYVFALPPRWNFSYGEGYVEAENIIKSNPLKTFNVQNNVSGRLNTDVICEGALSYMTFPDSASADKFVSECKEGKHPEVIKKYMDEMNVPNGAAI